MTIEKIGAELVGEAQRVFAPDSLLRQSERYAGCNEFFLPAIIMTLDLDYAHIAGFPVTGSMIYHEGPIEKTFTYGMYSPPVRKKVDGVFFIGVPMLVRPKTREKYSMFRVNGRTGPGCTSILSNSTGQRKMLLKIIPGVCFRCFFMNRDAGGTLQAASWMRTTGNLAPGITRSIMLHRFVKPEFT